MVEAGRADAADERTETRLFGALDSAFRDVPPSRIAGAVMITDGQVHDVPGGTQNFQAPLHALITGDEGETRPPHPLRERAALRHRRQAAADELPRHRHRWRAAARSMSASRSTASRSRPSAPSIGQQMPLEIVIPNAGRNIVELAIDEAEGETHRHQQPRHRHPRRHPRESARAARLRRAACRRAHLAQPAEVRRLRRPRAFHHPAPAGKAGRHADQRAVADRLPDARAVRREDQRFRPDHLRPLPAPRRAADPLLRLHRRICRKGRRAADRRRPRICRRAVDRPHAADVGAAGHADRPGHRPGLLSAPHRSRPAPPGHARPRRLGHRAAALEPLVPPRSASSGRRARSS